MTIVIPREVWGPRYDNGVSVIGVGEWLASGKELWLHHSVTTPPGPDATLEQDCAHMRYLEQIGEDNFEAGISYTWLVFPSGRCFEGHGVDRQGTHTYMRNNKSRAVCLVGNYDVNALPQRMQNTVAALLREIGALIDGPHSQVYATACPGQHAKARISDINALAQSGGPIEGEDDVLSPQQDGWLRDTSNHVDEIHATIVSGAKRDAKLNQDLGFVLQVLSDKIDEAVADVDEDALAAALAARGVGGTDIAAVKAAFVDVLRRGTDQG